MIKAVLLDLDNTLLINPDKAFVIEYIRLLENHFRPRCSHPDLPGLILAANQALKTNQNPAVTNFNAAMDYVVQSTDVPALTIKAWVEEFLSESYPALKSFTQPADCGAELVAYLHMQGVQIAIATNPLYPAGAVSQRLKWAGLSSNLKDYAFVSHAENMHFVKPDPAYYAEVVGRVGVEPDEAVMVGDSTKNDIQAAAALGIRTFHITQHGNDTPSDASMGSGTLRDFYRSVRQGAFEVIDPLKLSPEMVIAQLWGNLAALYGLVENLPEQFWVQHPDPDEWSVQQVVCHLADSEVDVQRPRLQRILEEANPFLSVPKTPLGPYDYVCENQGLEYARRFHASRQRTLDFLNALTLEDWKRPARDSVFGPTTLLEMAYFTAQHDRLHLRQICQTIGKCE